MTTNVLHRTEVLDDGFVELIDVMGSDDDIVDAARCSVAGEGVRKTQNNTGLIRHLMRHRHTSPFEMAELKFRIKVPIFVMRQWIRHRTANVNEMSGRYSELPSEWYVPEMDRVCHQSKTNKQGSGGEHPNADWFVHWADSKAADAFTVYESATEDDIARETARIVLPLSTYTVAIWKIDLHNLLHFLALRCAPDAQYEIRVYANAMADMVKARFPATWASFEDYRLNSMQLSWQDQIALGRHLAGQTVSEEHFPTKREHTEWLAKIQKLNDLKLVANINKDGEIGSKKS